ncbi:DcaP family trimeric outer membrane transporter [Chitinophaga nivalis]|uniref:DcaP family trimeric outer membrane transporter n=1 Tax=Chitinophaga nivalis TaxID=2991709 RepID=A0ABT3ITH9_9BACT|nr:DcaP family trimeric outer membrane transporter [Chitinophaga nivalis]MCW3487191.1 DcaP family trimeric outer membrane transporter [Chitinophaga nivalis]
MKTNIIFPLLAGKRIVLCVILMISMHVYAQRDTIEHGKGLTRNLLEGGRYNGFLFTDVKGIRLQFNGYVQADFIHDFMEIENQHAFQPSTIPVPSTTDGNTAFSIRQSRFSFSAYGQPDKKGRALKAVLEFDLWGSTSGAPRLRHAYIQHGKWTFGQYWSNFMDADNWPNILDYWGPNSYVWIRQAQLRFTQQLKDSFSFSVAVEQPGADINIPATWKVRTFYPDVSVAFQKNFGEDARSHIRVSGLFHPLEYRNGEQEKRRGIGGAFNFSGSITLQGDNAVKFQFAYGNGFAKYSEDLGGQGLDGYAAIDDKRLRQISMLATWLYYDHFWSESLGSTIGWGYLNLDTDKLNLPVTLLKATHYSSLSMTYYFTGFFKIGGEVLYGIRKNSDYKTGDDIRAQFSAFFKF